MAKTIRLAFYKPMLLGALMLFTVSLASHANNGFRGLNWGASADEVIQQEGSPIVAQTYSSNARILGYPDYLGDMSFMVYYIFVNNKLVQGEYVHYVNYDNKNAYIYDYMTLHDALAGKYGVETKEKSIWNNKMYIDQYHHYGRAVSLGHLKRYEVWNTQNTRITLYLQGKNGEIDIGIEYLSKSYQSSIQKAQQARLQEKL